jgi:predicted nucleic acid-binding protein
MVESDAHHRWAVERFQELATPFLTCEPVLAETFYLLSRLPNGSRRFFDLLDSGLLATDFDVMTERETLRKLVAKYDDLPMSLADACLVRMAELNGQAFVFTVDSHFQIYRKHGRRQIPVIMP